MNWSEYYNKKTFTLNIPYDFDNELTNLPSDVKIIIFENNYAKNKYSLFNGDVDDLPKSLICLTFGHYFNQNVDNLPKSLTHLTFGHDFNQNVDNLPKSLTHLTFGFNFNKIADNLPNNLVYLEFYSMKIININIPNNVEYIKILFHSNNYFNEIIDNLPLHIKKIKINFVDKSHFIKKIPFDCKIIDEYNNEIFL